MMSEYELRVGNYIRYDGKIVKATAHMIASPVDAHPIQLTDNNLKRMSGAREVPGGAVFEVRGVQLYVRLHKFGVWDVTLDGKWRRHIRYVHELQNIYYAIFQGNLYRDPRK